MSLTQSHKTYFNNLDGLRALAALAVVGFHCVNGLRFPEGVLYDWLGKLISFNGQGGPLGVAFFFILSGFLITYLLFQENARTRKIKLGFFYLRRLLRIWPLYYLTLLIGFIFYPLVMQRMGHGYDEPASGWMFAAFLANFDHIRMQGSPGVGILGVQWSLSVEEQFYLFWPILFLFKIKPHGYLLIFVLVLIGSEWFFWSQDNHFVQYYHLISNMRFLAMGAIIAGLTFFQKERWTVYINRIPQSLKRVVYVVGVLCLFIGTDSPFSVINHFLPLIFFSFIIVDQCFAELPAIQIGKWKGLRFIGKISYGVYLLHMIVLFAILNFIGQDDPYYIRVVLTFVGTIGSAYFIYQYFEKPFLRLKQKFNA